MKIEPRCTITVNYYATLRALIGDKNETYEVEGNARVETVLDLIVEKHSEVQDALFDKEGNVLPHIHFFINDQSQVDQPGILEKTLRDGDVVSIFPSIGGGD